MLGAAGSGAIAFSAPASLALAIAVPRPAAPGGDRFGALVRGEAAPCPRSRTPFACRTSRRDTVDAAALPAFPASLPRGSLGRQMAPPREATASGGCGLGRHSLHPRLGDAPVAQLDRAPDYESGG
jgi:hypothetical protein